MGADFSLLQTPNFAQAALSGYQAGQALGLSRRRDAALSVLSANPDNPAALTGLAAVDPNAARQFQETRTASLNGQRDRQFRTTLGALLRRGAGPQGGIPGGENGGAVAPSMAPTSPALIAGGPVPASSPALAAAGVSPPALGQSPVNAGAAPAAPAAPIATAARGGVIDDEGFNRLVEIDPEAAMKAKDAVQKMTRADLDTYQAVNAASLQMMGGVHDQATYDAAKAQAEELHQRYGTGLGHLNIPDNYDPKVVEGLMVGTMKMSQQLAAIRAEKRLTWDIEDDQIDNGRADRNTDSMIEDRGARRSLIARGQDMTDSRGRYGIGVASSDRHRGQDMSASTAQRGQDMTDKRVRETSGRRSGGAAAVATSGKITRVAVGANGKKVGWNGAAWVPVQ